MKTWTQGILTILALTAVAVSCGSLPGQSWARSPCQTWCGQQIPSCMPFLPATPENESLNFELRGTRSAGNAFG